MNLISKELLQAKNEPLNYFNKNSLIIIGIVVLGLFLYPFIFDSLAVVSARMPAAHSYSHP